MFRPGRPFFRFFFLNKFDKMKFPMLFDRGRSHDQQWKNEPRKTHLYWQQKHLYNIVMAFIGSISLLSRYVQPNLELRIKRNGTKRPGLKFVFFLFFKRIGKLSSGVIFLLVLCCCGCLAFTPNSF